MIKIRIERKRKDGGGNQQEGGKKERIRNVFDWF